MGWDLTDNIHSVLYLILLLLTEHQQHCRRHQSSYSASLASEWGVLCESNPSLSSFRQLRFEASGLRMGR